MDTLLEKIAVQIPQMAALVFLVVIFLKAMAKRDSNLETMQKEFMEAYRHSQEINEDCVKVMTEVAKVMERCSTQGNHRR